MSAKTKGVPFSSKFLKSIGSLLIESVASATQSPVASAILELISSTRGFLPPRMTGAERTAIVAPAEGLVVYDLTAHKLYVYGAASWEQITSV